MSLTSRDLFGACEKSALHRYKWERLIIISNTLLLKHKIKHRVRRD